MHGKRIWNKKASIHPGQSSSKLSLIILILNGCWVWFVCSIAWWRWCCVNTSISLPSGGQHAVQCWGCNQFQPSAHIPAYHGTDYKMLSYRRETALQGTLVLAGRGRLELAVRFNNLSYVHIVHAVQNTVDSCINSATDRRGHLSHLSIATPQNHLGPPFRRSAFLGYYCYNNPNPNPIPNLTLTL